MSLFIGRSAELRTSLDMLRTPSDGIVQDIVGVHGIGKSVFLDQLSEEARAIDNTRVFNIDMKRHGLGAGFFDDLGSNASSAVLWEVFTRSRELMGFFADQPSQEFDTFREVSRFQSLRADRYLAKNDITLGRRSQIEKAEFTTILNQSDEAVRQHIRELQSEVDEAFIEAWEEFTVRRRVLITVDTFELVADDEMGQWIVRLARRLPNTLTVIARTPAERSPWASRANLKSEFLALFDLEEVTDYLTRRLPDETVPAEIAEITHRFTDGHPGGVSLVGDLIVEKGPTALQPKVLRQLLDRLPIDEDERWAELVILIFEAIRDPRLRRAVDAAAVTTTFDTRLLAELIDPGNPSNADAGNVVSRLIGLRMFQQVRTISGGPSDRFRLHEFIRLSVAARLRTFHPPEWLGLHEAAAQYYFRMLLNWEEGPYDSYGSWYRFEDPEWQECKQEWLWHSGMLANRRTITRARFVLVFLEAFWWWGYYLPFPFMRRMLEDWSRTSAEWASSQVTMPVPLDSPQDDDQLLLEALTDLINEYPVGHLKPSGAQWDKLRDKLLQIRALCGLRQSGTHRLTAEEKQEMKRVDAFITLFLAQTRRFRDPSDPKAEKYYQEAENAFRELADNWTTAWLLYEQADLALERRDLSQSAKLVTACAAAALDLATATEEWDHELLANLHRTRADACWLDGKLDEAARSYGRAVAHAYWFNGDPNPPDEYTQQFYVEMTTRAAERILSLADRPAEMEAFVRAMQHEIPRDSASEVTPRLMGRDVTVIREQAFPSGPATDELRGRLDSAFMISWNVLHEDSPDPRLALDELISLGSADERAAG